ncbi:hypothetical protein HPB49_025800 [Dermacentor silvarum]|nr:hypothetical protein HPB49_025800 [Dermacentor silvarum]
MPPSPRVLAPELRPYNRSFTSMTMAGSPQVRRSPLQLSEATPEVDNHLLHLWEARHCLVRRWRRQKHNRKLKIRIAELTQRAAEYAAQLADSNWVDRCNTAARQMSSRSAWRLFRALIDPSQTRAETQNVSNGLSMASTETPQN